MLPRSFPIFPLPNAVLFPNVFLPLHIFEPRYRAMVADALEGDRVIGMVLLKPGHEAEYEGRPPVYPVGCAGLITHAERLNDGGYNIVLRGIGKFRILDEDHSHDYRIAHAESLPELLSDADRRELRGERRRVETMLLTTAENADVQFPPTMPDEDLVNALAQYLAMEPLERQALLERDGPLDRCRAMADLLEMKVLSPDRGWNAREVH